MIKATAGDKDLVLSLLQQAGDGLSGYPFKNDQQRELLLSYLFDLYFYVGEIWLSGNRKGCALIIGPGKFLNVGAIRQLLKLAFSDVGRVLLREVWHYKSAGGRGKGICKMIYIRWICVDPLFRRRGTGGGLLGRILEKAAAQNHVVYIDTNSLKDLEWLERFGFEGYDVIDDLQFKKVTFLLKRCFNKQVLTQNGNSVKDIK